MKNFAILALISVAAVSGAVVVPNSLAATEGDGTFSLTSTSTTGRTYRMTIAASQLTALVNTNLNGMRFRMNGAVTAGWPTVATNFADWEIRLGASVAPSAMTNTFATNFTGGTTLVRDGAMSFGVGSFSVGGSPNAFGTALDFNQTSYLYTGGNLGIEMRFTGQTGATIQPAFDAVTASLGPANGWGVDFSSRWVGNIAGTTGGNANFLVTDILSSPVPEPATMIALGAGALALVRRRRNK